MNDHPNPHQPGCQEFPTGWLCVSECTTVWHDKADPACEEEGIDAMTVGTHPRSAQDDRNAAYIRGRRDMAAEQAKADPARDAELRAEGAQAVRERVKAALEGHAIDYRAEACTCGYPLWSGGAFIAHLDNAVRAALTEAGGES